LLAVAAALALGDPVPGAAQEAPVLESTEAPAGLEELAQAAQGEGALVVAGCLRRWANYGEIFDTFSARYGIGIRQLEFDLTSSEQLDAIRDNSCGQGSPSLAPDLVMVTMASGPALKSSGLAAPYKVQTWDSIPDALKDPDGYWFGQFYGNLAFEVRTDLVAWPPKDWDDLFKPEYQGQFALGGNPRRGSLEALVSLDAAGRAAAAGLGDPRSGLEFFSRLYEIGNLVPIIGFWGTVRSGDTPIIAAWDFNAMTDQDKYGPTFATIIPASGAAAGVQALGISACAQHPNAARLFAEFLLSDEGQTILLKGHAHPIRLDDLVRRHVLSDELLALLAPVPPGVTGWFPTQEELEAARIAGEEQWVPVVGDIR
jgi:putative spermidine/putrescine transport system substrate-binding protein